ncbi:MAG: glycosyltransferase [Phascolarctobacterium sp.]|nr:glycosyltransferase [Phascolarctobacterium sp.]
MKPKVTILMAIYKPNIDWLIQQLDSLNNQTYTNIDLIVWNDFPEDKTDYNSIYSKYITKFPFEIHTGVKNEGSNIAFQKLTLLAQSDYVAYCDQDDIWLPDKIKVLVKLAESTQSCFVCSDMYIVDKYGEKIANSITKVRPHHIFYNGKDQFEYLCSRNFAVGCTTLVKTSLAKKSVPFPKEFVHDWWLALNASLYGKIFIYNKPLINYRIHGNNQTGVMTGVYDKYDYLEHRIQPVVACSEVLNNNFANSPKGDYVRSFKKFALARREYYLYHRLNDLKTMFKYRYMNPSVVFFEILLPIMPNIIFKFIISNVKKGKF